MILVRSQRQLVHLCLREATDLQMHRVLSGTAARAESGEQMKGIHWRIDEAEEDAAADGP